MEGPLTARVRKIKRQRQSYTKRGSRAFPAYGRVIDFGGVRGYKEIPQSKWKEPLIHKKEPNIPLDWITARIPSEPSLSTYGTAARSERLSTVTKQGRRASFLTRAPRTWPGKTRRIRSKALRGQ